MIKLISALALLLVLSPAARAQYNPDLANAFQIYSCQWDTATDSAVSYSVAVPTNASTVRFGYVIGVSVKAVGAPMIVTVRTRATTNPSSTATVPVRLNAWDAAEFRCYRGSNASLGDIITAWPLEAGESVTIPLDGIRFSRGGSNNLRNTTVHIAPAAGGYVYMTWKLGAK